MSEKLKLIIDIVKTDDTLPHIVVSQSFTSLKFLKGLWYRMLVVLLSILPSGLLWG